MLFKMEDKLFPVLKKKKKKSYYACIEREENQRYWMNDSDVLL